MTADTKDHMRQIGELVIRERTQLGLTQAGLARAAEVDVRAVRGLENGTRWPWDTTRTKIERALGLGLGMLEQWRADPAALADHPSLAEGVPAAELSRAGRRVDERPVVQVQATFGGVREQLRAANIGAVAERMTRLPAEDIARVQDLVDELGRARFADWDDDDAAYDLAWNRRAKLAPLSAADEQAVIDSLDDID